MRGRYGLQPTAGDEAAKRRSHAGVDGLRQLPISDAVKRDHQTAARRFGQATAESCCDVPQSVLVAPLLMRPEASSRTRLHAGSAPQHTAPAPPIRSAQRRRTPADKTWQGWLGVCEKRIEVGNELGSSHHRPKALTLRRGVRLEVHMRPEEENPRAGRFRCAGAPRRDALAPVRGAIAPIDHQQSNLRGRRQGRRVGDAGERNLGALSRGGNSRGDDQIASEEGDRHSTRAGSASNAWSGCGCTPFPFDPLSGMPSIT